MMKLPKLFFSFVFLFAILVEPICSAIPPAPAWIRPRPFGGLSKAYKPGQNKGGVRASSRLQMPSQKVLKDTFQVEKLVRGSSRLQMRSQKVLKDTFQVEKLFVFGDSYVDTGNRNETAPSWKDPYGQTYPGHPAGRFSDGRIFTDYLGDSLGLHPLPYRDINPENPDELRDGANFAFGGAGVLESGSDYPTLTTQIGYLKGYLDHGYLNKTDLENSLSLFSVNGNDYAAYLDIGFPIADLPDLIKSVVDRIAIDLTRLCDLGAGKIAVTTMPPPGCTPWGAVSPTQCNETFNAFVLFHNFLLNSTVSYLNSICGNSSFDIIDIYGAFETVFDSGSFPNPYHACCVGTSSDYACGDVDENGQPMYTVCDDPNSTFYWDLTNPTQAGWNAVSKIVLEDPPEQINYSFKQ